MRLRTALSFAALFALLTVSTVGCGEGTDVSVAPATGDVKPAPVTKPEELKGVAKRAVGAGSSAQSGKLGRNPIGTH
jgi:hypothetical protein